MVHTPDELERYPLLRDVELTDEQRRWRPQTGHDLWFGVLPSKVEVLREQLPDGTMTASAVQLENDSEVPWDWRSVAFWRAALPESWQVQLSNPGRLTLVPAEDWLPYRDHDAGAAEWVQAGLQETIKPEEP